MKKGFSRRSFLGLLGMATAVTVAAPVIETVTTFLPPPSGWPREQFSVAWDWGREPLRGFAIYDDDFAHIGDKPGDRISMRFVKEYDMRADRPLARFDVLCGTAVVRPELALTIKGA